ncbi:hypothetical protein AS156_18455 [Bradyrhizobium macuxiense]|uniref:Uncharacterized protein n=1 Tax=Bradyrhizobium macuxiense TaxID=1755647 RepID=A0A109JGL4_9BRAD|nr:hypothetical protein AS156_18455 [Bradyrhizobium macuxiense]
MAASVAFGGDAFAQMIGVIGCVDDDDLDSQFLDQCGGLRCIVVLACGEREADRTSQAANCHMYRLVRPPRERPST